MEDVWKNLTLSSLQYSATTSPTTTIAAAALPPPNRELDLRDFLACPLNEIHRDQIDDKTTDVSKQTRNRTRDDSGETEMLSFFSAGSCALLNRKRSGHAIDENTRDRKRKRLMKSREAADRSRARKQAYKYELELKVAHLTKENAKLRQQQEKLCLAVHGPPPKTPKLSRTLTAPF